MPPVSLLGSWAMPGQNANYTALDTRRPKMTSPGGHTLTSLFLAALLFNGCKERTSFAKAGPLFTAAESSSPAKVLVHVYWPREEQGRHKRPWVGLCDGMSEEIEPDRYTTLVSEPSRACFFSVEILRDLLGPARDTMPQEEQSWASSSCGT